MSVSKGETLLKKKRKMHPNSLKAIAESRKPFKKNNKETGEKDERINRKGAPDTTSAMRALVRSIGADLVQLERAGLSKNKHTRIVSRITKKLLEMYDSPNPTDSMAILKAGWPGLLSEGEEEGKPKELVLKIVYENKRVVPDEEEIIEEGNSIEEGSIIETGEGGGSYNIRRPQPQARWGLQVLAPKNENITEWPETFCVICQSTVSNTPVVPSVEHRGWVCQSHLLPEHSNGA